MESHENFKIYIKSRGVYKYFLKSWKSLDEKVKKLFEIYQIEKNHNKSNNKKKLLI